MTAVRVLSRLVRTPSAAPAAPSRPMRIERDLWISPAEAEAGAEKELRFQRWQRCAACQGRGAAPGAREEVCPACHGLGEDEIKDGKLRYSRPCLSCRGAKVRYEPVCASCAGSGAAQAEAQISVIVPPGVKDGAILCLADEGNLSAEGSGVGDLMLTVRLHDPALPVPVHTCAFCGATGIEDRDATMTDRGMACPGCFRTWNAEQAAHFQAAGKTFLDGPLGLILRVVVIVALIITVALSVWYRATRRTRLLEKIEQRESP